MKCLYYLICFEFSECCCSCSQQRLNLGMQYQYDFVIKQRDRQVFIKQVSICCQYSYLYSLLIIGIIPHYNRFIAKNCARLNLHVCRASPPCDALFVVVHLGRKMELKSPHFRFDMNIILYHLPYVQRQTMPLR